MNSGNNQESRLRKLKIRALMWWYGGVSKRQALRKKTGVLRSDEPFEPPEHPNRHWTAIVVVSVVRFMRNNLAGFIVAVAVGIVVLAIGQEFFGGSSP
ncbi:hypothetical protein RM531_02630 [Salinisphaera sp. P385]|uniref:Uncharacterized protein n=1 Tax=Spectribacter acetivorans TaxID=3075603 RepID=A0ABU3B4H8_9GAMM|nr:hypothetical protein [Salinisphaera sp. P385]MDT0617359.1 hypothetical protein [Salinisphaera sp. P385]